MTLQEASIFFESLKTETTNKSEKMIYEEFIYVLSGLTSREFTKDEIQSIESELDSLNVTSNPENRKKYFKKALGKFEKFLKDTFFLTRKGYYTKMGIGLGSTFGILLGIVFLSSWERSLGIAWGLSIGIAMGLIMGQFLDSQARVKGKML